MDLAQRIDAIQDLLTQRPADSPEQHWFAQWSEQFTAEVEATEPDLRRLEDLDILLLVWERTQLNPARSELVDLDVVARELGVDVPDDR